MNSMKKSVIIFAVSLAFTASCTKESGNSGVIKNKSSDSTTAVVQEAAPEVQEETHRYVAEDGTNANVTFGTAEDGNYISILSNNKTIRANEKEKLPNGAVYETHDIVVRSEDNRITITQENNIIELKKAGTP